MPKQWRVKNSTMKTEQNHSVEETAAGQTTPDFAHQQFLQLVDECISGKYDDFVLVASKRPAGGCEGGIVATAVGGTYARSGL
jgi:hypothetical protein